jgi:hypothetical protein
MNSPRRVDSTSLKKDFESYSLKKDSAVDEAVRKLQKEGSSNELS